MKTKLKRKKYEKKMGHSKPSHFEENLKYQEILIAQTAPQQKLPSRPKFYKYIILYINYIVFFASF